jgi:type II secretory ATPase GspE/PulE/Tfp pilus assembly ATPase PilB-like protein
MPERLFTAYQVADLLDATPGAVVEWIQKGWLPVQRLPDGPLRISEEGLIRFLKQRGVDIEKIMAKVALRESQESRVTQAEREALVAPKPQEPAGRRDSRTVQRADRAATEEWVVAELNREEKPELSAEPKTDATRAERSETPPPEPVATGVAPGPTEQQVKEIAPAAATTGDEQPVLPEPAEAPPAAEAPGETIVPQPADEAEVTEELAAEPSVEAQEPAPEAPVPLEVSERPAAPPETPQPVEGAAAAAQLAEAVIRDALGRRASHIHLESVGEALSLRLRIDGVLHDKSNFKARLPRQLAAELLPHFMSLAGPSESQPRPQGSPFSMTLDGRQVGFHLSSCPTARGLRVVITMPEPATVPIGLSRLGLERPEETDLRRLLRQPCGLILLAGRPGPLQGEAMRAMITSVDFRGRSVVSIERAARRDVAGVTVALAKPRDGLSFGQALGAFAQQDADVIACEDLRDPEAAMAALEAAEAGKLVLAGINSPAAAEAIGMLFEMGLEPWPLASNLLAVVSFARVRILCPDCKTPAEPDGQLLEFLGLDPAQRNLGALAGQGCPRCSHTGYAGAMGLLSVMMVDGAIAQVVRTGATIEELNNAARRAGVKDLRQIGLDKVRAGLTSLEELARVLPT